MTMTPEEFKASAESFSQDIAKAFLENVDKAIKSGGLAEEDYNYLALRAIAVITAESFHNSRVQNAEAILKNLRCFI